MSQTCEIWLKVVWMSKLLKVIFAVFMCTLPSFIIFKILNKYIEYNVTLNHNKKYLWSRSSTLSTELNFEVLRHVYDLTYLFAYRCLCVQPVCVAVAWGKERFFFEFILGPSVCAPRKQTSFFGIPLAKCTRAPACYLFLVPCDPMYLNFTLPIRISYCWTWGIRWRSWLRHYATSRKVAGSIPDGVIGNFHWHNPSRHTIGPVVDSAFNRNA